MKPILTFFVGFAALLAAGAAAAQDTHQTSAGPVVVERVIGGLDEPWALGFLPGGGVLVTERDGRVLLIEEGTVRPVSGVPRVAASGQGGLLDLAVARDFARSGEIFLTYSQPRSSGAMTALAVARLDRGAAALSDLRVLFEMQGVGSGGRHFGARVVEAPDGTLFVTLGDRGERPAAQDPRLHNGKVVRVTRDGGIPADNPFADGAAALAETWSLGHRNIQGAALDAEGRLWTVEHGARGGDEINRPEAGKNYGWPVISYGRHYSGGRIGEGTSKPGLEQPLHYWDPSIAPSGMAIPSGRLFPDWEGDLLVGSLKFDYISRLERGPDGVREAEQLFRGAYTRIRDVREAPDGTIWFLSVGDGAAYRIRPG